MMQTAKLKLNAQSANARKAEKLTALAGMIGPEAMATLRQKSDAFAEPTEPLSAESQARAVWQRNRLLERLRLRQPVDQQPTKTTAPYQTTRADNRIATAVDLASISKEHPAVIAHVLAKLPREERIAVLKTLPGPIARAAIQRLRSA